MRLSLRWKISAGFVILLGLVGILAWVTFAQLTSLRAVQRQVFNDAVPGLVAVDEIVRSYTAQQASVGFFLAAEPGALEQYRSEVANAEHWEGRAESLFTDPAEEVLLDGLRKAGDDFQAVVERVVGFVSDGKRSQAIRVLRDEGTPAIAQIETLGRQLATEQDRVVAVTESEVDRRSNQTIVVLAAVTIGALLAGVALAIALPRRLSANLAQLVAAARAIERGNFEQELDIRSGDEVEELAQRFVAMQSGLLRLQQLALQDRELEIAADIQRRLLQRKLPEVEGVRVVPNQRQANRVGGDWYDVDAGGRWLTVAIGDASGKGIAAALMATVMLSSLRAERSRGAGPKRVIEQANLALLEATDAGAFTTCVYATVDTLTGEVRWLNMGHPDPFLLHAPNGRLDDGHARGSYVEGPRNRALGWYEDPGLDQSSVTLAPGDRLILFTDGFIEAKSADGEVFGEHRLETSLLELASLPSDALAERVVEDVERFAAGKLDDDLTMLVIEFQGAAVPATDETLVLPGEGVAREPDDVPPASRLGAAAEPGGSGD
ncbi:MAG TPA: SpoIIE family protein phosphatase [Actinomycetota bacterium]|nr:SpoIIE family protein phosphatase [Actinomycetota bacterium]